VKTRSRATSLLVHLWALPTTSLGLGLVGLALLGGGRARLAGGVIEAHGSLLARLLRRCPPRPHGVGAITLGHVVIAGSRAELEATREHERCHVRQAERWGPLFLPAYLVASAVALARGGSAYRDNRFEVEARGETPPIRPGRGRARRGR
jgi:hypothetical protein